MKGVTLTLPSPEGLSFPINFDRHLDEAGGAL
jgi:hypothetical protein